MQTMNINAQALVHTHANKKINQMSRLLQICHRGKFESNIVAKISSVSYLLFYITNRLRIPVRNIILQYIF